MNLQQSSCLCLCLTKCYITGMDHHAWKKKIQVLGKCAIESHKISKTVKHKFYHRQHILSLDSFMKVSTKSSSLNNHCLKVKNSHFKGACPWKKFYCLRMRQLFHNDSLCTHTETGTQRSRLTTTHFFSGFCFERQHIFATQHWVTWYLLCSIQAGCCLAQNLCYQLHLRDILWGAGQ